MERRREIYIRMENLSEIMELMKEIKMKEEEIHGHFDSIADLKAQEEKIFKTWGDSCEELLTKLDQVIL